MRKELEQVREVLQAFAKVAEIVKRKDVGLWTAMGGENDGVGITVQDCIKAKQAIATLDTLLNQDKAEMVEKSREEFDVWFKNTPLTIVGVLPEGDGYTKESVEWAFEGGYKAALRAVGMIGGGDEE